MLGVIGGSGIYQLEGLSNATWREVHTPFGAPSDAILVGDLDGHQVAFLPRHGRGHRIPPSQLNVRANISALKQLGVTDVLSLSAVGSLDEKLVPGAFVVVDQLIDWTRGRQASFFDEGLVGHVGLAHPYCSRLLGVVGAATRGLEGAYHHGGTYLCMEGPAFSTRAESMLYRKWGAQVIGMTASPEAKLAREAELCFTTIAMVTDFDCWHDEHDAVTASQVVQTLQANSARARALVKKLIPLMSGHPAKCPAGCDRALDTAILTAPEARDVHRVRTLASAGLRLEVTPAAVDDPWGLKPLVRTVDDFPKKGIRFRDVTTLLENGEGFATCIRALADRYRGQRITRVLGIDARGFILGGALAAALGCGFAPVRKKGKLPGDTVRMDYALEYGTDTVEMRTGSLGAQERVVVVDDLIATGGTCEAAVRLARLLGATVVEACFAIELPELGGRKRLEALGCPAFSLMRFEGH